ncbi:MAG: hypothetical protein QF547_08835, partial [Alphaproteobacteria bacterium]|nr:hypothetical protein [Alphaproteobacteria bacterium]
MSGVRSYEFIAAAVLSGVVHMAAMTGLVFYQAEPDEEAPAPMVYLELSALDTDVTAEGPADPAMAPAPSQLSETTEPLPPDAMTPVPLAPSPPPELAKITPPEDLDEPSPPDLAPP